MSLITVLKDGVVIHEVETVATSIFMRGDGWMNLGTFSTVTAEPAPEPEPTPEPEPAPEPQPEPEPEPEPVPEPTPATLHGLPRPTNADELQAIVDAAAANRCVMTLAPGTRLTIDKTIVFRQEHHDGTLWGLDGAWANITWNGPAGQDMFRYESVPGVGNRGFVLVNVLLYGGGWPNPPKVEACLRIRSPGGTSSDCYKPTLQNIYTSYAKHGIVIEGAVFEFSHLNLHAENCTSHGMVAVSLGGSVMSNVFGIAPNMSRNGGSGIFTGYSHNVIMGSFIQNSRYGVEAPGGLRVAAFNNGENTGEALFALGSNGYGSVVYANEMSSGWIGVNNHGRPSTGPSKYVLAGPAEADAGENHVAIYGGALSHGAETRVMK